MSRTDNPEALLLEQRCIVPGHWLIEGRHVRAVYEGRSRKIMSWSVEALEGDTDVPPAFIYLNDVRKWIRNQENR